MKVTTVHLIAPNQPAPTVNLDIEFHLSWDVNDTAWDDTFRELDVSMLCDASIPAYDANSNYQTSLDLGVDLTYASDADVIAEFCGAFREVAENVKYYLDHADEYDGHEASMMDAFEFQYDPTLTQAICNVLYGCDPEGMDVDDLFMLAEPSNWYVVGNPSFIID